MAIRRIAINLGGGYLPGLGEVVRAAAAAAARRGWDVVGIRDGFDGLLYPERYAEGGVVGIDTRGPEIEGSLLGTGTRTDPFHMQCTNADGCIEDIDASPRVRDGLNRLGVGAMLTLVGGSAATGSHALSVMWKLSRQGLPCVCIPKSVENDLAATAQPYGYDSIRAYACESLRHVRIAMRDQGRVALVEVPGQYAGWLALDGGLAAGAAAVLIPELPYAVDELARHIDEHRSAALIIVAEGARPDDTDRDEGADVDAMRARFSPVSDPAFGAGARMINRSGRAVQELYEKLQRRSGRELLPLVLDQLVRAGPVSSADRLLGAGYATAAIQALADGCEHHLLASHASQFQAVPLAEAVNRIRTVSAATPELVGAQVLGICMGQR